MKRSFTISGIEHIIRMLNQYPQLSGLSSLAPVFEVGRKAREAVARSGCNCSASPVYAANKHVFDMALGVLGNGDHLIVKNLLKVDQICYYVKSNKGQVLKCI
jgi:hypothetical protein